MVSSRLPCPIFVHPSSFCRTVTSKIAYLLSICELKLRPKPRRDFSAGCADCGGCSSSRNFKPISRRLGRPDCPLRLGRRLTRFGSNVMEMPVVETTARCQQLIKHKIIRNASRYLGVLRDMMHKALKLGETSKYRLRRCSNRNPVGGCPIRTR